MKQLMHESHSRRRFLQTTAIAGVGIMVNPLPLSELLAAEADPELASPVQPNGHHTAWMQSPGVAKSRVEGLAKVMGKKIYARDFRAKDLPSWPKQELSVMILRATLVDRIFESIDLSALPKHLKPMKVITATQLAKDLVQLPWFYPEPLLAKPGKPANYYGQAVALLFFKNHRQYLEALPLLLESETFIKYGPQTPIPPPGTYGDTRFVLYREDQNELFSTVKDGPVNAPWQAADSQGSANARAMYFADKIAQDMQQKKWRTFEASYATPCCDPMFMEGEAGLGYFNLAKGKLELVMGTQSPLDDAEFSAVLYSHEKCPYRVKQVVVHPCYPGGGFGGRDHSLLSMYIALAAVYAEGQPVRLIQSRVEQFQGGIKRHASTVKDSISIDEKGKFQALTCEMILNGGGQNNFSFAVAAVGAHNAPGAYYFPRSHVHSVAQSTVSVTGGSMRGFGTLQSMFALECLVDEAAEQLKIDPIELRLKNLMTSDNSMITGARPAGVIRSQEILEAMRSHPLWKTKASRKSANPDVRFGVGVALALKTFGTAIGDAVQATVSIDSKGRISLISNGIDMGNGSATSFSVAVARYLGSNASEIKMGATTDFEILKMVGSLPKDQEELDKNAKNPHWSPIVSMATAASTSAFNQMHAIVEAAKIVFDFGLWPAALDLWGQAAKDLKKDQVSWQNGVLQAASLTGLALKDLAAHAHKKGLVVAACTHAYFMGQWAAARFKLSPQPVQLPVDGLAVRYGGRSGYDLLLRDDVEFPPIVNNHRNGVQTYTPCGALAAVEVNIKTGETKVVEVQEFLDPGPVIVKQNVEGQSQGGIAMAIGHALFEQLPEYAGGPGQGKWNLHRYTVAKADDVPIDNQALHILKPLHDNDPAKGIAEIVMIPVLPAIVNAIAAATGKRFRSLPVTAEKVKEAMHG